MSGSNLRAGLGHDDEIAARRAVAGVAREILDAGGTPEQADAMAIALQHFLLGDLAAARSALVEIGGFKNGTVQLILDEFAKGAASRRAKAAAA